MAPLKLPNILRSILGGSVHPGTVVAFVIQSAVMASALCILGFPLVRLVRAFSPRLASSVAVPLLGLYPLVQVGWVWSEYGHKGLNRIFPILVGIFALLSAMIICFETIRSKPKKGLSLKSYWFWLVSASVISLAMFVVYVFFYRAYFHLPYQTPASLKNYDMAAFAVGAEHLRHLGFSAAGNIAGVNLGSLLRSDTSGTFMVDLFPATLFNRHVWQTANSVIFVGWVILAWQLFLLLHGGFRITRRFAVAIAVVTAISPLMFYIVGNGFISQIYGTSLCLAGIAIVLAFRLTKREVIAATLLLSIISATLWHIYPFVSFVMPVLALPIRLIAHRWSKLWRVACGSLLVLTAQWLFSTQLAFGRFRMGWHQAFAQGGASAGWPLPGFGAHQMLGFSMSYDTISSFGRIGISIAIAVSTLLLAVVFRRDVRCRMAIAAVAVGFGSYAAIYVHSGVSYQQWKWAALVAPLITASYGVLVVSVIQLLGRRILRKSIVRRRHIPRFVVAWVPVVAILLFGVVYVHNISRVIDGRFSTQQNALYLTPDLVDLSKSDVGKQANVGLRTTSWADMWTTSFFPNTKMYHLTFFDYYPLDRVSNTWILESKNNATAESRITQKESIDASFQLIRRDPAGSAQITILDHATTVKPDGILWWKVRVTNTGSSAWVSPADDAAHGFTLDVSLVSQDNALNLQPIHADSNVLNPTYVINDDYVKEALPAGVTVKPGHSYVFEGSARSIRNGLYDLQFDAARTDVGEFQIWTPQTIAPVAVG